MRYTINTLTSALVANYAIKPQSVSDMKATDKLAYLEAHGTTAIPSDDDIVLIPFEIALAGRKMREVIEAAQFWLSSNQSDARTADKKTIDAFLDDYEDGKFAGQDSVTIMVSKRWKVLSATKKVDYLVANGATLEGTIAGCDGIAEAKALLEEIRSLSDELFESLFTKYAE